MKWKTFNDQLALLLLPIILISWVAMIFADVEKLEMYIAATSPIAMLIVQFFYRKKDGE